MKAIDKSTQENYLEWRKCMDIYSDAANAIIGKLKETVSRIKQVAGNAASCNYVIHRYPLKIRRMPHDLKFILHNVVKELWLKQDGATCHTARATIDLLKDTFGDRLISRFRPVIWPPRSCDLTPLEYLLWGYVKSLVYADKPQTLDYLEDNISRVIADIRPQVLEKVVEN
ncbi:transposable element Tc3 transposase [Trichonephila clavipes]|nr:transposable element Tc3 transposase [Trichonephila clavipes]